MRIVQISHAYPPTFGGVESHVQDLAHGLAARGHQVLCLAGGVAVGESDQQGAGVRVARSPDLAVQSLLAIERGGRDCVAKAKDSLVSDLHRVVCPFRPDVVHVHNAHHFSPMPAAAILSELDVPCVNTVHDRTGEHVFRDVLELPWSHVLYVSRYVADALPSPGPHSTQWLGIDLDRFSPRGRLDPRLVGLRRPVIFHPARMLEWKGLHVSIRALAELKRRGISASLVLCGSTNIVDDPAELRTYRRHLEALAADLGVLDDVHFLEFDRSRIAEAYRAADLIWYPTIEPEPLGLVPIEAMATGTPVVVSDAGGMRETVVNGRSGVRVRTNDEGALAVASLGILSDPKMRDCLIAGGFERSRSFDLETYLDSIEKIYERLADDNGPR